MPRSVSEMLPPSLFEGEIVIEVHLRRVVTVRLKARNQIAAQDRWRELRQDDTFQKQFCKEVADHMWSSGNHWFEMDAHDDLLQVDLVTRRHGRMDHRVEHRRFTQHDAG